MTEFNTEGEAKMTAKDLPLGATAADRITGFTGVVTGYVQYLTGCHHVLLAPRVGADGAPRSAEWFDVARLQVDRTIPPVALAASDERGFDKSAPVR